jgi:LysR family transcriptional regulator, carnitine catabolism transcriptional activator
MKDISDPRKKHSLAPSVTLGANLTLRQLKAFLYIAKEESITRAAEQLHLTPSAISMLIRSLEIELSVKLFDRTTRKLVLTESGERLLPTVKAVFTQLNASIEEIHQLAAARLGNFTIATSPLLAAELIPKLIASFSELVPGIHIRLLDLPVDEVARAVLQNEADFGICTAPDSSASILNELTLSPLYKDRLMLACPMGHHLATKKDVHWADLAGEPLALLKLGSGLRRLVDQGFQNVSEVPQIAFEVSHVATAVGLVDAGLCSAVLPSYTLARSELKNIVVLPLSEPLVQRDIVVVSRMNRALPAPCEAFIAHFKKNINDPYL